MQLQSVLHKKLALSRRAACECIVHGSLAQTTRKATKSCRKVPFVSESRESAPLSPCCATLACSGCVMEWSWDGSIISLSSVPSHDTLAASSTSDGPRHIAGNERTTSSLAVTEPALDGVEASALSVPALPAPPQRAHLSPHEHHPHLHHPMIAANASAQSSSVHHAPGAHPLASLLLGEHPYSPPASPTASLSSFQGSRTRLPSGASAPCDDPRTRVEPRRSRPHSRDGSISSAMSTNGSAHETGGSSEDDQHSSSGFVMPSLHAGGQPSDEGRVARGDVDSPAVSHSARASLLVVGRSSEERRVLATLLARDDDARCGSSSATDMSYSFLSTGAPAVERNPSAQGLFREIAGHSTVALHELADDSTPFDALAAALVYPLERLEAKMNRAYPATTGLDSLVQGAGCGEFEACFFLFSSRASVVIHLIGVRTDRTIHSTPAERDRHRAASLAHTANLSYPSPPSVADGQAATNRSPLTCRPGSARQRWCAVAARCRCRIVHLICAALHASARPLHRERFASRFSCFDSVFDTNFRAGSAFSDLIARTGRTAVEFIDISWHVRKWDRFARTWRRSALALSVNPRLLALVLARRTVPHTPPPTPVHFFLLKFYFNFPRRPVPSAVSRALVRYAAPPASGTSAHLPRVARGGDRGTRSGRPRRSAPFRRGRAHRQCRACAPRLFQASCRTPPLGCRVGGRYHG